MDSFMPQTSYFSPQTENGNSPAAAASWYTTDNLSDCSLLPSPICDDAVTPEATNFYLDPMNLSSNFNDCEYNSMSLFDDFQVADWLSDADQDLTMSSPFSRRVASPAPLRKSEAISQVTEFQRYPESFSSASSPSPLSDVGFTRDLSQDLSLSPAEIQRLTAIALGHLPPPSSPSASQESSQNTPKIKTEVRSPQQSAKPERKRSGARAAAVKAPAVKRKNCKPSHNQIEKKYRTNLNSKISELRDCIPALRSSTISDSDDADEQDSRHVSKARILTAAVTLITSLEKELEVQRREAMVLKSIVQRYHPQVIESLGLRM